jgi:hypothetical protein
MRRKILDWFKKDKTEEQKIEEKRGDKMTVLYDTVKVEVEALIAAVKNSVADKTLTLSEVWAIAQQALFSFVKIADALEADGADKKAVVLIAAEKLYDDVIAPIDIPKIPNVVEPYFDKLSKILYMELISGTIDFIVKFKKGKVNE